MVGVQITTLDACGGSTVCWVSHSILFKLQLINGRDCIECRDLDLLFLIWTLSVYFLLFVVRPPTSSLPRTLRPTCMGVRYLFVLRALTIRILTYPHPPFTAPLSIALQWMQRPHIAPFRPFFLPLRPACLQSGHSRIQ